MMSVPRGTVRTVKTCRRCGSLKKLEDFAPRKSARDGRTPWCRSCLREYHRQWRAVPGNGQKHREAVRRYQQQHPEQRRQYQEANRERLLENGRRHYARHREKRLEKNRRWYAANPDYNREKSHRRRAQERGNGYEPVDRQQVYDRDKGLCHLCGGRADRATFTLDHLVPISKGGPHSPENVKVAHPSCNFKRHTKPLAS